MKTVQFRECPTFHHSSGTVSVVIVAGGRGSRLGGSKAKQYLAFLGQPLLTHSIRTFLTHPQIKSLVFVHPSGDRDYVTKILRDAGLFDETRLILIEGGDERSQSVLKGVSSLPDTSNGTILIHDAARPGVDHDVIDSLLKALTFSHGAAPALPVVDALKRQLTGGQITGVSREALFRIQTPQAFRSQELLEVLRRFPDNEDDEFAKAEKAQLKLELVEGHERLGKITFADDFERLERIMSSSTIRTGMGYDVHAFESGDSVTLCGVSIPHDKKLKGHSDADVGWHALTDAILGALAAGDIGDHFPPSDPKWKGAPSSVFLEYAGRLVSEQTGRILNLDLTIICEAPKVKPHREAMRRSTADLLGLEIGQVSVKATTTEELGFEGRREGIAAQAIATLEMRRTSRQTRDSE